jgi:hypothetical protein
MQNQAAANRNNHCAPWVHGFMDSAVRSGLSGEFEVTSLAPMDEYLGEN